MDAAEYKHVTLGLVFLKYVSDSFSRQRSRFESQLGDPANPAFLGDAAERQKALENPNAYLAANTFWVPEVARWDGPTGLLAHAKHDDIGNRIDAAMEALERGNSALSGVLPKNFAREELDGRRLGELVSLISVGIDAAAHEKGDVLGRVYEYFLGQFAASEGKGGGEFYTPQSVVRLLVEMLEPFEGRVYDPACGSGGMFVQTEEFVLAHGGNASAISVYGQESNATTWRIARMNLALHGIEANLGPTWGDTFHDDKHPDLQADFVLANPPFNISDWGGELLVDDARWQFGSPPAGNANFAWLQHILQKLSPSGAAGVVLANGSMSSTTGGEDQIRRQMVENDLVECMVALPGQLFYSTPISVCLWFLRRDKSGKGGTDRRGEVLFVDARGLGALTTRVHREFSKTDIDQVADALRSWRGHPGSKSYVDRPGFCASATLEEIATHGFVLTPGRYVGVVEAEIDTEPVTAKVQRLASELDALLVEAQRIHSSVIRGLEDWKVASSD